MATITYTFTVRDTGTLTTGLTPTFATLRRVDTVASVIGSAPSITEIGGGHYKFSIDWDVTFAGIDSLVLVVDAGVAISEPVDRYVTGRLNAVDAFPAVIDDIDVLLTTVDTNITTLDTNLDSALVDLSNIEGKVDLIDTNLDGLVIDVDSVLLDVAAVEAKVDIVDTVVDGIAVSLTTLSGDLSIVDGKIDIIDTNVDTALVDLATIEGKIDIVDTNVDALVIDINAIEIDVNNIDTAVGLIPTAAENADAIWDEATSGHTTVGTFGKLTADVYATADNIWEITVGKWEVTSTNELKLYKSDNTTLVATFNLFDISGVPANETPAKRERV